MLKLRKQGKTIVLSTHFMDEADILGDKIGILAYGSLQCVGTPEFLKQRFGLGYSLNIVMTRDDGNSKSKKSGKSFLDDSVDESGDSNDPVSENPRLTSLIQSALICDPALPLYLL
jgi:ABC-type multidrug transport system ATPase subunit